MAAKRITDIEPIDRPREKIEKRGASSLKDFELIAAILGNGTKKSDVLSISKRVSGLIGKDRFPSFEELCSIEGIGQSKAAILMACFEFSRRYGPHERNYRITITEPEHIRQIPEVMNIQTKNQEYFMTISLNGASEVIETRMITMGILNHSLVHPREVYADAITDRAAAIICVHNHPSGNPNPSQEDIRVTRQLSEAGTILGIQLLDHIIITKGGLSSLRSLGYL